MIRAWSQPEAVRAISNVSVTSRERLVGERTALINQLRAILLDRGIVVPQAKRKLEQYLVVLMNEHGGEGLSARMRMLVADIRAQWQELDR